MRIKEKINLSAWVDLVKHLYRSDHGLSEEQRLMVSRVMRKAITEGVYDEDSYGIHGIIRTLLSAIALVDEIGLKQSAVIVVLIYRAVLKGKYSVEEAKADFGAVVSERVCLSADLQQPDGADLRVSGSPRVDHEVIIVIDTPQSVVEYLFFDRVIGDLIDGRRIHYPGILRIGPAHE